MEGKKKKVLFIDRDGTIIEEYPPTYQIDAFEKVSFYPNVFTYLGMIARELDYELVLVTNQDGLGTAAFPEETFWPAHNLVMSAFANEGIVFARELIDRSYPEEGLDTRKPGIGMFTHYIDNPGYDLAASYVIGDRVTDIQLAKNLGCRAIWINTQPDLGGAEVQDDAAALQPFIALATTSWKEIHSFLKSGIRKVQHHRRTAETSIEIALDPDGSGQASIHTGLHFFDHMLDQIARHGMLDLSIRAQGDLHIDEHHTIEDTGIALGEAFRMAAGDKRGMERYGFSLPMDDAAATVLLDFGGRSWVVWNLVFTHARIGDVPAELYYHFFKSFADAARCNLHVTATGENDHHKIEAVFKAFAKAIRMAVRKDPMKLSLPSTKGLL